MGVHLAVVDPDVGAERRAVALRLADDRILVGPDNGLLSLAAERAGGVIEAVDIAHSQFRLEPVSATFHGRDIFAPVSRPARGGGAARSGGHAVRPGRARADRAAAAAVEDGTLVAHAIYVDRFGNVQLDVDHEDIAGAGLKLGTTLRLERAGREPRPAGSCGRSPRSSAGMLLLYEDAYRRLALAVSHGERRGAARGSVGEQLRIVVQ